MRWLMTGSALVLIGTILAAIFVIDRYKHSKTTKLDLCGPAITLPQDLEDRDVLYLIGDSRIFGLGIAWPASDAYGIVNLGVPGETTSELKCRIDRFGDNFVGQNKTFVLQAGINDLVTASMHGQAKRARIEREAAENLQSIIATISGYDGKIVVLSVVPPINADPMRRIIWGPKIDESVERMNSQLKQLFSKNATYVDLNSIFRNEDTKLYRQELSLDALHWNMVAYQQLINKLEPLVTR